MHNETINILRNGAAMAAQMGIPVSVVVATEIIDVLTSHDLALRVAASTALVNILWIPGAPDDPFPQKRFNTTADMLTAAADAIACSVLEKAL